LIQEFLIALELLGRWGRQGVLRGRGAALLMIMSALHLSRMGAPKTEKDVPSQSHPGKVAWRYSPGGTGMSGLISPPPDGVEPSNKGSQGIALGPAMGDWVLGPP